MLHNPYLINVLTKKWLIVHLRKNSTPSCLVETLTSLTLSISHHCWLSPFHHPICFCVFDSPFLGSPPFSEPSNALLNPTNWIFEGRVMMENSGFSWVLRLPKPTSCSFCAMPKLISSPYPPLGVLLLWVSPLWACYNHPCYLFFLVLQILYWPWLHSYMLTRAKKGRAGKGFSAYDHLEQKGIDIQKVHRL